MYVRGAVEQLASASSVCVVAYGQEGPFHVH